jgi:excisionase family DNA binding protein
MSNGNGAAALKLEAGDFLTVEETARLLRLTISGVLRLKDREHLPSYKVGNRWLFNRHEVALWLAARRIGEVEQ